MKRSVMVIDDDAFFRSLAREALEQEGYGVAVASSWVDFHGAYYACETRPDVILFDVNLGSKMTGDKLLALFKKNPAGRPGEGRPKMVLFSGMPERDLAAKAEECEADGYIPKNSLRVGSSALFITRLRAFLPGETD